MSASNAEPTVNRLLATLPLEDRRRFVAGCKFVEMEFAEILSERDELIHDVYFPIDGFVSLTKRIDTGGSLEVGLIGAEGMLGISLLLGVEISPLHAVVQGEGTALCMSATRFVDELAQSPALDRVLKLYLYVMRDQLAQIAICCRFHVVEQRLARWLLMTQDRARSSAFHITHEILAYMLGVRRVGVTEAATALQNRNLIRYSRGRIEVLDRVGLESSSCECYASDNAIYTRTMGELPVRILRG